uniref:EGF-like domain-containing protein n=1 Tax=Timema bartmani TaxID=61472 RepID=A0A7R9F2H9_9NEOP|nr:unnamed protein product [Timema bartmani]
MIVNLINALLLFCPFDEHFTLEKERERERETILCKTWCHEGRFVDGGEGTSFSTSPNLPQHDTSVCVSAGFRGKNCEENIDDCPGNLCLNGATCVDDVNRYSCVCPPTYTGELCEQDVDECAHRPSVCQNGATCTNSIGGYSCICVNGWTGPDCSVNIDDCAGAACFNGATCIDRVGSFYCRCTPGKTGMNINTLPVGGMDK